MLLLLSSALVPLVQQPGNEPALFQDLNQTPSNEFVSSAADNFVPTANGLLFAASRDFQDRELWVTDSTPAGTAVLTEFVPGNAGGAPDELVALDDGRVLFEASTVAAGKELWVTDGTALGTQLVADIRPGPLGSMDGQDNLLTAAGAGAYFFADDGVHGRELWWTDGTAAGTTLALDISPGSDGSQPAFIVPRAAGDAVVGLRTAALDSEVWLSDGTPSGTTFLTDHAGLGSFPTNTEPNAALATSTGRVVWGVQAPDEALWSTDGTPTGTGQIIAPPGAFFDFRPEQLTGVAGWVYYTARDAGFVARLMRTDGTLANTGAATAVDPSSQASAFSEPTQLAELDGRLAFAANSVFNLGTEPWIHDPGTGLSRLLANVANGSVSSSPSDFALVGDRIYFSAWRGDVGRELWRVGDTPATLELVADIAPGLGDSSPAGLTPFQGGLAFRATDPQASTEPFFLAGGSSAPTLLADIADLAINAGNGFRALERLGQSLVTSAVGTSGDPEDELWASTGGDFAVFASISTEFLGASTRLERVGDRLLFAHDSPTFGLEPWVTDGTPAGTQLLADINPTGSFGASGDSSPVVIGRFRGEVYLYADIEAIGNELYATDGTPEGSRLVADINAGPQDSDSNLLEPAAVFDDALVLAARGAGVGEELWATDGSSAGTVLLHDIVPGPSSSRPEGLTPTDSHLYFSAATPAGGREPWRTDGTPGGAVQLADLRPGGDSNPVGFTPFGDRVLFAAEPSADRRDLYAVDGAGAVANLTATIAHFDQNRVVQVLGATPAGVVFRTDGDAGFSYYWVSDGTTAGTTPLALLDSGQQGPGGTGFISIGSSGATAIGDVLLFMGFTPDEGRELWRTDGTVAGTALLADLQPGPNSSLPTNFRRLGNTVVFVAQVQPIGAEFWSLPMSALGTWDALEIGGGCAGSAGYPPSIGFAGSAGIGSTLSAELRDAPPGAPAALYISGLWNPTDLGPCRIYLGTLDWSVPAVADGAGQASIDLPIPTDPALVGLQFWLQYGVVDAGGEVAGAASTTPALEVLVGP